MTQSEPRAAEAVKTLSRPDRSIRNYVSCDGKDDTEGVARAFAAARAGAFTLIVDCPVSIKVGMDISRSIFIDDGTTVQFTGGGKFTVDNTFIPAFVIADARGITLKDWQVEYDASLPVNEQTGGYVNHGTFVRGSKPANAFNDQRLEAWLTEHRGIVFDKREGNVNPPWGGVTNPCAVIYITGDSSDINVTGMRMSVPENAGGERFIPVAFAFGLNYKAKQTVTAKTPMTAEFVSVPHGLAFSDITLDGTYMGWVGGLQNARFENIRSLRYGDLQDATGGTVGGERKWFAPPHLFYLAYSPTGDAGLFNRDIQIRNVVDSGVRLGRARDKGSGDSLSGYALSLKIGCVDCIVDHYTSARPDGLLDVLSCDGMTISNVSATYDSSFLNDIFPGWRFPASPYRNLTIKNVTLTDLAPASVQPPIGDATQPSNDNIQLENVRVVINRWIGKTALPTPVIAGTHNDLSIHYSIKDDGSHFVMAQTGPISVFLKATPAEVGHGGLTNLSWNARNAAHCHAGGAWSGELPASGSRAVTLRSAGDSDYMLECRDESAGSSKATLHVSVGPSG